MNRAAWSLGLLGLSAVAGVGCRDSGNSGYTPSSAHKAAAEYPVDALRHAIDVLGTESYDSQQALDQAADRLTQWLVSQRPTDDWKPDPMIATLPEELRSSKGVTTVGDLRPPDAEADCAYIQQSLWLRDISNQMRANQPDDLVLAQRLFDWTVRNIQLETDRPLKVRPDVRRSSGYWPWEVLLLGHGTSLHRAWLFTLLAREQGLDVVVLAQPSADGSPPRPWAVALLHEGELYLFDPALGLPIPGPGEKRLPRLEVAADKGENDKPFRVATLKEVAADDGLLRQLDVGERAYPVKAEDLKQMVALVEGNPLALSRRMQLIESKLAGEQRAVLAADPSSVAEQLKKCDHISDVRLWSLPFEVAAFKASLDQPSKEAAAMELAAFHIAIPTKTGGISEKGAGSWDLLREPLLRARLLHFRGQYNGETGAKHFYMLARPRDVQLDQLGEQAKLHPMARETLDEAKQDATYWIGLVTYEEGDYATAIEHLSKRTLEESLDTPWAAGARYNLARAFEAAGHADEAIKLYEADDSPQQHGNLVRAQRLKGMEGNDER